MHSFICPALVAPSILHIIQNVETGVGRKSSGKLPRRLLQTLLFSHTAPADKRRRRRISLSSNLTQIAKFVLGNSQTEVDRKKKKILQQQKVWMLETFRRERTLGATMPRPSMPRSMHGKVNRRRVTWLMKKRRCNKLEFNPSHRRHPNPRPFISSQQRLQWHHYLLPRPVTYFTPGLLLVPGIKFEPTVHDTQDLYEINHTHRLPW